MIATRLRLALVLTGLASACAGLNVGSDDGCAAACAVADSCGFLPSNLGFDVDRELQVTDCERRCGQSPRDDPAVATLLACLDGSWTPAANDPEIPAWCGDPGDDTYAAGLACATASACLQREFKGSNLLADVALEVALISFHDYEALFGADTIAALYGELDAEVTSCAKALCGPSVCSSDAANAETPVLPCDDRLCRMGMFKSIDVCGALEVDLIEVVVAEQGKRAATQVLFDENLGGACKLSSLDFPSEGYQLHPGPIRTAARISGSLPASELAAVGWPADTDGTDTGDTDTDSTGGPEMIDYCLLFPGMSVTVRGGENIALVPVGDLKDLAALRASGVELRFCER